MVVVDVSDSEAGDCESVAAVLEQFTPLAEALEQFTPLAEALEQFTPLAEALEQFTPLAEALEQFTPLAEALEQFIPWPRRCGPDCMRSGREGRRATSGASRHWLS